MTALIGTKSLSELEISGGCDQLSDDRNRDRNRTGEGAIEVGVRLVTARKRLELTQKQLSEAAGISLNTHKGYELGKSVPGGIALAGYARAGININWLLGDTAAPMLLKDERRAAHADLIGEIAGDPAAAARAEARREANNIAWVDAQQLVTDAIENSGHDPGPYVAQGLAVCVWLHGLSASGVKTLLLQLRIQAAENDRKPADHPPDISA